MRRLAICVLLGLVAVSPIDSASPSVSGPSMFLYTVAKHYDPVAWINGGERFALGSAVFVHDAGGERKLVPSFAASADPAVSFDAKRVLFAGKQAAQDRWQIWEISFEAGELRRISNCAQDCVRPLYLPENRIVYAEKTGDRFVIQAISLDVPTPLALTYWPGSAIPGDILRDGRVLFESTFPSGEKGVPELYTVYSDGSGVESYRCDHGKTRYSGKQVSSGDIVFSTEGKLERFTSAIAKQVDVAAPRGEYAGDVAETGSGEWLLPWRPSEKFSYQLMWWKPGGSVLRPALQVSGSNVIQPVFVAEHAVPNRHPSGLHEWSVGNLLCLNSYTSKYSFAPASIHSVRLYTKDKDGAHLLGTAPVEADGSFFVQVSGDQPLQIELLDAAGKTLKREAGWFWLRRGEQRACVGCHAGPEAAPENAVPMILLKSTTPADMTHPSIATAGGY